jgi:hypothetical protein
MNTQNNADLQHINIEELASSNITEIRKDLSNTELNGVTGGIKAISPINIDPIKTSGCSACCSGYDPRFEDKKAAYM